jgi:hypothetical protein
MPRAILGELAIDIPIGWEDQSTLSLVSPALDPAPLLRAKPSTPDHATIAVKQQVFSGDPPDLEELARAQEQVVAQLIPGSRVLDRGRVTLAFGAKDLEAGVHAVTRELSLPTKEAGPLRQLQLFFCLGSTLYVFTGTGPNDQRFDALRSQFLDLASSMRRV